MLGKAVIGLLFLSLHLIGISGLSVSGNKVLDDSGKAIYLRGVVRPSFEWNPLGQYASQADYALMKSSWNANTVRITANQGYWLSTASQYVSGYKATIAQQISWIRKLGMYAIIDLHWSGAGSLTTTCTQQCMADANSITFWTQVANIYKNDTGVLFELYNEPYLTDWNVWQKGGNTCGFAAAGMQQMYDAIRGTGAKNIIIICGINYAFDLSGVASHPITGNNIMFSTHPYNYGGKDKSTWDAAFGYLIPTYPVIATEFGQYCDTSTYVADLLSYMQAKGMHWTAWAWWVGDCSFPSVISDWNGNALGTVGTQVKNALLAGPPSSSAAAAATSTSAKSSTTTSTSAKAATTTTAKTTTTTTTGSSTSGPIVVVINTGCNSWYFAINSISGAIYSAQSGTQTVSIKDSSANAPWLVMNVQTWGWSVTPPTAFVLPISIKLTTTAGKTATMTNAVTSLVGVTLTVTTSYV